MFIYQSDMLIIIQFLQGKRCKNSVYGFIRRIGDCVLVVGRRMALGGDDEIIL
jgi:hypothetical protein